MEDLYVSSLKEDLNKMSDDGGVVLGHFSVFVPFEGEEIEEFFSLCDRFDAAVRKFTRAQALQPCRRLLSLEERWRETRALAIIQDTARLRVDRVGHAIRAFRARVRARFLREREGKKPNRL